MLWLVDTTDRMVHRIVNVNNENSAVVLNAKTAKLIAVNLTDDRFRIIAAETEEELDAKLLELFS